MAPVIRFPLDPTGTNPNNLVINEAHALNTGVQVRAAIPMYGPFYAAGVVVTDAATNKPLAANQYSMVDLLQDATMLYGQAIYCTILITDTTVSNNITITYQVLGGEYQFSDQALQQIYSTLITDNRTIDWASVLNKPTLYPPSLHEHLLADVYGFESVVAAIERVRNAIVTSDIPTLQALIDWANKEWGPLSGMTLLTAADVAAGLPVFKIVTYDLIQGTLAALQAGATANDAAIAALQKQQTTDVANISALQTGQAADQSAIAAIQAAIAAIQKQQNTDVAAIAAETAARVAGDNTLTTNLNGEITRAENAEAALASSITNTNNALAAEVSRATGAENTISTNLANEVTRAKSVESGLQSSINTVASNLAAETTRAEAAESTLTTNLNSTNTALSNEVTRAKAAESALSTGVSNNATAISAETTRATNAEATLTSSVNTLTTNLNSTNTALSNEVTRAKGAESTLSTDITNETNRATAAEASLSNSVSAETSRAQAAEAALSSTISSDVSSINNVINTLSSEIVALQNYDVANTNGQGVKTISTSTPVGGSNGDVWYQI